MKQVKVYPLSKAANPPAQRLLDLSDVMYNGLVNFDETFFTGLSHMLNEETVQPRDLQMMGMLLPLGIEKGKEFKPDAATVAVLKTRGGGSAGLVDGEGHNDNTPWWPDSQWVVPTPPITMRDRIQVGDAKLFWRGCTSHRSLSVFLPDGKARHRQFLLRQPFTTTAANRWRAGITTGCTFRRMFRCASSGPSRFTA